MIEFTGTFNQVIKGSGKRFGGALVVFEGHPQLLVGGFNFNLDDLPAPGVVLPCGTPVYCDEAERTITPIITAKVEGRSGTEVTLESYGFNECAFKVGDVVGKLPDDPAQASQAYATITAVNGNVITLDSEVAGLTANGIIATLNPTNHKLKVKPNAILPYDVVRDANAISVDGDGMIGNDRPLLERRMPPYNDALKEAVQENGHKLTFSNRK